MPANCGIHEGILGKLVEALIRLLGGWYEWETQTTEPDGCWRTWGTGFPSLDAAMKSLEEDRANGKQWNPHMPAAAVKWRVERRIVWTRYYEPTAKHIDIPPVSYGARIAQNNLLQKVVDDRKSRGNYPRRHYWRH